MVKLKEVIGVLETAAPLSLQEDYDNCGLIIGSADDTVKGILITLDVTEAVIDEAIRNQDNLVVAHHPVIFRGLKKINDSTDSGRAIRKAIKHDINIYAIHTNLDNVIDGVNGMIADRLELKERSVLSPRESTQLKLITFCPTANTTQILEALHEAGAGIIGNYDHCSFRVDGTGSYRPNELANPYQGTAGQIEQAAETRLELQFPEWKKKEVLEALKDAHPYEEVAYFIQPVHNTSGRYGSGITGLLKNPLPVREFLEFIKEKLELNTIKHTEPVKGRNIQKVALCGGAGSFLIPAAIASGADAYVTADIKYHEFFRAENRIVLADIGHYESEKYTKDLLYRLLNKKISNIALHLSEVNTNPVHYI